MGSLTIVLRGTNRVTHTATKIYRAALVVGSGYRLTITGDGSLTITDSAGGGIITRGYGASGSDGGAIVNNGKLTLSGGTITGNRAASSAGAVLNKADAAFTMTGGTITGNTANDKGAGIYARGESALTLSGPLVITGNSSTVRAICSSIWTTIGFPPSP